MKMTNFEIYDIAYQLKDIFNNVNVPLPVKLSFYVKKNQAVLLALAQEIEDTRIDIIKKYGVSEGENIIVDPAKTADAEAELRDLFSLEQDVNIYKVDIDAFPNEMTLTSEQMDVLMFMIN